MTLSRLYSISPTTGRFQPALLVLFHAAQVLVTPRVEKETKTTPAFENERESERPRKLLLQQQGVSDLA